MTTSSSLCYRKNYPHIRREMLDNARILAHFRIPALT